MDDELDNRAPSLRSVARLRVITGRSADKEPAVWQNRIMPRLFGMCGISFSGKTTLAKAISSAVGADYIGLDDIDDERGLRGGDGIPGEEWERTSRIAVERLGRLLNAGRDVVLDDTLCFRWLRDRYAEVARQHAAQFVLIYVSTPLSEIYKAMARNDLVGQRAPIRAEVFEEHVSRFEAPSAEEEALVFSRDVPVQEWLARYLSTGVDHRRSK